MAVMTKVFCRVCGETKQEARSASDYTPICSECSYKEKIKKEREWRAGREGLTIEERLRDIENFMYHHGTHYKGPVVFG